MVSLSTFIIHIQGDFDPTDARNWTLHDISNYIWNSTSFLSTFPKCWIITANLTN